MKAKHFRVIRPEGVIGVRGLRGWMHLPFCLLRIYAKCIRLFSFPVYGAGKPFGTLRILSIPKLTIKRADAS